MKKIVLLVIVIILAGLGLSILDKKVEVEIVPADTNTEIETNTTKIEHETPDQIRAGEEITLAVGEAKQAAGLEVTLNQVTQDFRCASDEVCPELGGIAVNATFGHDGVVETKTFSSDEVPHKFAGYAIAIVKIDPVYTKGSEIKQEDYSITFYVYVPTGSGSGL